MRLRFTCRVCSGSLMVPLSLKPQDVVVECAICRARHRVTTTPNCDIVRYLGNLEPAHLMAHPEVEVPAFQESHA